MSVSKLPLIVFVLTAALTACLADPMKESPQQLAADIDAGTQRAKLAGAGYVECTLAYAESHRKSEAKIEQVADDAANSCRKFAVNAGIYQNQIDVFRLIQVKSQHSSADVAAKADAILSAEQRTMIMVSAQRPVIVEYLRRSKKLG
jgi:hypothetical protein